MVSILVTGGNGQLANNLKDLTNLHPNFNFLYRSSQELDITNLKSLDYFFKNKTINYCINCAAYTAVDNAEKEIKSATEINEVGAKYLASFCAQQNVILIHISTDFVFDGLKSSSYTELDNTNPQSIYGLSKLKGELAIKEYCKAYFIIRTSWLYSEHNNNFMKTMINLSKSKNKLNVVDDQIGTPTYAKDLAEVILHIIKTKSTRFGLYHYSNEGVASWYDFANSIFSEIQSDIILSPIKTKNYSTPAKRPYFSVLDKSKIKDALNIEIPHWRLSLKKAIMNFNIINT